MVSSSNNGVNWRRRIASRARPTSTFLNISPSNSRSSTNCPLQLAGATGRTMLFALERGEDRPQQIRSNQVAPILFFAAQPNRASRSWLNVRECFAPASSEARRVARFRSRCARNLRHHSTVARLHETQGPLCPACSQRGRQRLQNAFLFCRWQVWQDRCQTLFLFHN